MKLVLKTLAVVAVSSLLMACGERPVRPKAASTGGTDADSTVTLSKNVVNVVTKKDLKGKILKVKVDGEIIASPCQGETLSKFDAPNLKYTIVPQESEFGVRNVFVVHEYQAVDAPIKKESFQLISADSCNSDSAAKVIDVNVDISDEDVKLNEAAKTYFGFGVVMAEM